MKHNDPVITPDGPGVVVGRSKDGKLLLCSRRIPIHPPKKVKLAGETIVITQRCAFKFYRAAEVQTANANM